MCDISTDTKICQMALVFFTFFTFNLMNEFYLPKIRRRSTPQNEYIPTDGKFESVIRRISSRVNGMNIGPIVRLFRGPRIINTSVLGSISLIGIDVIPPSLHMVWMRPLSPKLHVQSAGHSR